MVQFVVWWLIIQVIGLAALPISRRVFRWLPDCGYTFAKTVGLLLVSYLLWVGASGGLLENDLGGAILAVALVAAISAGLALSGGWERAKQAAITLWRDQRSTILIYEILLLVTFALWVALRAYAPSKIVSAYGEKYMEIAFLNGVLNSTTFPPLDPWLAGFGIAYYYFGYVMMAVMTRLSGAAATVGFELYDALLFALTAAAAFGIVSNLVAASGGTRRAANGYGLLGALFVVGLGNLEGLIHGLYSANLLPEGFLAWLAIPELATDPRSGQFYPGHDIYYWWWWRGSRILNDVDLFNAPIGAQPISEFPFFSFLLGDNHPHKLALPFVLLAIGLALNLFLRQISRAKEEIPLPPQSLTGWRKWSTALLARRGTLGRWLFYALALGALAFLNTWDFPIYLGLALLAHLVGSGLAAGRFTQDGLARTFWLGVGLGIGAVLLYLLFYLGFSSQASGVLPHIFPPTRLAQYFIIFGPFLFILAFFLPAALRRAAPAGLGLRRAGRAWLGITALSYSVFLLALVTALVVISGQNGLANPELQGMFGGLSAGEALAAILTARITNPWTFLALSGLIAVGLAAIYSAVGVGEQEKTELEPLTPGAVFAVLLAVTGLALTLVVEFFYLRDSFGVRMNTVFKFYFQGWVLMALASAYGAWWLLNRAAKVLSPAVRIVFSLGTALLVAAALIYPVMGYYSRVHGFAFAPHLDGGATMAGAFGEHWNAYPDDWAVIVWMRENIPGAPVILEAPAPRAGYQHRGRISAFTGFPTLLGWGGHEYQWRGDEVQQNLRLPDLQQIFGPADAAQTLDLLRKWDVRYFILGEPERRYIEEVCQQPETACNPQRVIEKFSQILNPVFQQGSTTLYQVPE